MCALSQFFWTVSRNRQLIGVNNCDKKYIIGFADKDLARKVAKVAPNVNRHNCNDNENIAIKKKRHNDGIRLVRSMHENVSLDVKRAMVEMEMPIFNVHDDITIDVMAKLIIPKMHTTDSNEDDTLVVNCHESQQFMMLPFTAGVGIVMPYEVEVDTHSQYVFTCNVIDPSVDANDALF